VGIAVFTIDDEEALQLAKILSEPTGESMEVAIHIAVEERLAQIKKEKASSPIEPPPNTMNPSEDTET
jgi:hypothetical protein